MLLPFFDARTIFIKRNVRKRMKKALCAAITKVLLLMVTAVLLATLFLNVATLHAVNKIEHGDSVSTGFFSAIVGSGSMAPELLVNDLLIIGGSSSYQEGDVITYIAPSGSLVTHRIIEILDGEIIAQGDMNNIPDEAFLQQRVLGKVDFVVPGFGNVIEGILSPVGIALLVSIVVVSWLIHRTTGGQNENTRTPQSTE